jgi:hypothetical protein
MDGNDSDDSNNADVPSSTDNDEFYDAPLWSDNGMQTYADQRIAMLEQQLAESQRLVQQMQRQLILARPVTATNNATRVSPHIRSLAISRRIPRVLYAMGPQQLYTLFTWWWLSARSMKKRVAQWWTRRAANRGVLYWLVALLITREGIATLFGEVIMRALINAVHLRGIMA